MPGCPFWSHSDQHLGSESVRQGLRIDQNWSKNGQIWSKWVNFVKWSILVSDTDSLGEIANSVSEKGRFWSFLEVSILGSIPETLGEMAILVIFWGLKLVTIPETLGEIEIWVSELVKNHQIWT